MKKYSALILTFFLSLFVFFVLPQPQISYAVGEGGACTGSGQGNCNSGLFCTAPDFTNNSALQTACTTAMKNHTTLPAGCTNTCKKPSTGQACTESSSGQVGQGSCGNGLFCVPPPDLGSGAVDKSCINAVQHHLPMPSQCQSKCQLPVSKGGSCIGSGSGNCQANLYCSNNKCIAPGQVGQACTGEPGKGTCASGLMCFNKKCITPQKEGQGCGILANGGNAQGSCDTGLSCQLPSGSTQNGAQPVNGPGGGCDLHTGNGCASQSGNGVITGGTCVCTSASCQPKPPPTLPPPPSPPCKTWGSNGVCNTFGSTFGGFSTDPNGFIQKIFAILLSVSGGIALLLIIRAGYNMMTAQGNPEKLNNAREQLVAAMVGLVFLIFSFVFLQLIGFDILHIPGFAP